MTRDHRNLGGLVAGAALLCAGSAAAADSLFAIGPDGATPYTDLYQLSTQANILSYGAVGFAVPGGLAPLTSPLSAIAFQNSNLFAIGPDAGTPYTNLYQLNTQANILSYGAVGFAVPGGLAPLTSPLISITFDKKGDLFAVGQDPGTPYTNLYELNTDGNILQYSAVGFAAPGGLAPLTSPLTSIAFDADGDLFGIGQDPGTPYTNLYELNTDGNILQYGAVGFAVPGGLAPLTTGLSAIAFDGDDFYALGPDATAPYTDLYELNTDGNILSYGATGFSVPGGLAPLTTPLTSLAFEGVSGGVPEPAAWALMLAGFASLGAVLRARRAARGSVAGEGHARA